MIKVCIPSPPDEFTLNNWDYLLSNFSVDVIYIKGGEPTGTKVTGAGIIINSYSELPQDIPHILLAPQVGRHVSGTESLIPFVHPTDAIYIVGGDSSYIVPADFDGGKSPDSYVYIPTDNDMDMWSWNAMAVALYDRRVKNG